MIVDTVQKNQSAVHVTCAHVLGSARQWPADVPAGRRIRRLDGGKLRTVTVYAITSQDAHQATRPSSPPGSAATGKSRHYTTSDVSYGEGASQICTGSGPQVMAALRPHHRKLENDRHANIAAA